MAGKSFGMSSELYQRNFERFLSKAPGLALIVAAADVSSFVFDTTAEGERNLISPEGHPIHSQTSAREEAREWFSQIDLSSTHVLYVYGIGLAYAYDAAREWLHAEKSRYLVFFEDEPGVIKRFLETDLATEVLQDPKVRLHLFTFPVEENAVFLSTVSYFAMLPWQVSALPYATTRPAWPHVYTTLNSQSIATRRVAFEEIHANEYFYREFYQHLVQMARDLDGGALYGAFSGVPAIICGAGPSLTPQLPLLKKLASHALIFAGGSALTAVTRAGVRPHFSAGICPDSEEIDRFSKQTEFEVPLFYRTRLNLEAQNLIHGPHLYTPDAVAPSIAQWIDERIGIHYPGLSEGCSVACFLIDLIHHLGCDPVIFVGMDMALSGASQYAEGVIDNPRVDLNIEAPEMSQSIPAKDIFDRPIYTLWKWVIEQGILGELVASHPGCTYINATEGGIGIPGTSVTTLTEATALLAQRDYRGEVHARLMSCRLPVETEQRVIQALKELQESIKRCIALTQEIFGRLRQIEVEVVQKAVTGTTMRLAGQGQNEESIEALPQWLMSGELAVLMHDLEGELAYELIFARMLEKRHLYLRRIHDEFMRGARGIPETVVQRKLSIVQERYFFLLKAAGENLDYLASALESSQS